MDQIRASEDPPNCSVSEKTWNIVIPAKNTEKIDIAQSIEEKIPFCALSRKSTISLSNCSSQPSPLERIHTPTNKGITPIKILPFGIIKPRPIIIKNIEIGTNSFALQRGSSIAFAM